MEVVVLGAGIIGTSAAWHLARRGHAVTVIERQNGVVLETSFANPAQISVSYCESWANRDAPLKAFKWMFSSNAPLLFRPQFDLHQWLWSIKFLARCNDPAFERNVQQLAASGAYSHQALKDVVALTGIDYHRLERGIAHYFTDAKAFASAGAAAQLMQKYGVNRRVVSREELLKIEPALAAFASHIVGGTYTASDESGDAHVFTQALAKRCAQRGVTFMHGQDVLRFKKLGNAIISVAACPGNTVARGLNDAKNGFKSGVLLTAGAFVVACGSFSAPLLRTVGVNLPIYPGKGYSATFKLLKHALAPFVSMIDDEVKCVMIRLGNYLRIAGTIEVGGYDLSLTTPQPKPAAPCWTIASSKYCPACATRGWRAKAARPTFGPTCARPHATTSCTSAAVGQRRPRHAGLDAWCGFGQGPG